MSNGLCGLYVAAVADRWMLDRTYKKNVDGTNVTPMNTECNGS